MSTVATLAVALVHSVVLAQQEPVPPPMPFPPWSQPPPNYSRWRPPPPPMDDQSYQPQPPGEIHSLPWRPVSLTLSLGFASLTDSTVDYRDSGASFGLRLGAEIAQRLALTVGLEGTNAQRDGYNENQWAFLVGLQWFFLPQLYVRGAVGAGGVSTDDDDGLHVALGGGLGFELVQMADFALGVELAGTWLHLPKADWNSLGANLVVSFF
jgi:hypothetical protein